MIISCGMYSRYLQCPVVMRSFLCTSTASPGLISCSNLPQNNGCDARRITLARAKKGLGNFRTASPFYLGWGQGPHAESRTAEEGGAAESPSQLRRRRGCLRFDIRPRISIGTYAASRRLGDQCSLGAINFLQVGGLRSVLRVYLALHDTGSAQSSTDQLWSIRHQCELLVHGQ